MPQSLTNTNHFIPLDQAIEMTTIYREQMNEILNPEYQGQNILARCETFDRAPFDTVLAQPGCAGLRIYYGMDSELKVHAIIVGVNEDNEDMLPLTSSVTGQGTGENTTTDDAEIIEAGNRCPVDCPPPSDLNP
ncbi:MAG: hypothetical protein JWP69_1673 [Flaviaesturariibacter sp.]|nr:hypothetical protein [Flaviaesturariibacter sp.]